MNTRIFVKMTAIVFVVLVVFSSCVKKTNSELTIYAYDSFADEWGAGPIVFPAFEKETGIKLNVVVPGDSGELIARAISEKNNPEADIIIGIDNNSLKRAMENNLLESYKPKLYNKIPENLIVDKDWFITPYDWSTFTIMWDSEKLSNPPKSLEDLTKPEYEKKLVLMDPRTSTPGLGFVAWTQTIYGDKLIDYWKRLKPSILTMASGWGTGYGLFTSGEAPLCLSYTTSAAYHAEYETAGRFKAIQFEQGHSYQIECAGIIKGTKHRKEAEAFIDFMLDNTFQSALATTNWMYPVNKETTLPASYEYSVIPNKILETDYSILDDSVQKVMNTLSE